MLYVIAVTIGFTWWAAGNLKKKNRSYHWLWFALLSGWIPLIISWCLHDKSVKNESQET